MIITRGDKPDLMRVHAMGPGQVFIDEDDDVMIKTDNPNDREAITLEHGVVWEYQDDDMGQPVEAELVIS